ncbi:hypothetical protein [Vreelandella aquamarina]|uniref:hypothetical protein n=1 Tax=Vreelandella aquamarina TaxID=77097 RepID=UPI001D184A67|nr:hypothetical protein [Halomonas meridiana]MCC4288524.1 hypothetical protein [Halomonas meridiana]
MSAQKYGSGKYVGWVWFSWILFAMTLVVSYLMIDQTNILNQGMTMGLYQSQISSEAMVTTAICIGQTIAALIVAGGFTIANGIYEAVVERKTLQE